MLQAEPSLLPGDTVFVSGHLDLTQAEFDERYAPLIARRAGEGCRFVVGDAPGCDTMAQRLLGVLLGVDCARRVRVFHMLQRPRNHCIPCPTVGGFGSDEERDAAMTAASTHDIAWVRPTGSKRHSSGTAKNLQRRRDLKARLDREARTHYPRFGVREDWAEYEVLRVELVPTPLPPLGAPQHELHAYEEAIPMPQELIDRLAVARAKRLEAEREEAKVEQEVRLWVSRQENDPV
jgi:hypothetical protein